MGGGGSRGGRTKFRRFVGPQQTNTFFMDGPVFILS